MSNISRFVASLVLLASFSIPPISFAAGNIQIGGDCTSNSTGCAAGLYCVPGDYGSVCSVSSSGPGGGGGVNNRFLDFYKNFFVGTINNVLVPILIAIAFIVFLWGVFKYYIWGAENETERKSGHQLIIWGIIGFVVILSVWGIVNVVKSVLIPDSASSTRPAYPTL